MRVERKPSGMDPRRIPFVFIVALAGVLPCAPVSAAPTIVLESGSFRAGGAIGPHYASTVCAGDNFSPSLWWHGVPGFARSLVLTVHDPQGRGGAGLWHWIVFDIPASSRGIASSRDGKLIPAGSVTAANGHGRRGYSGPCPPRGTLHQYTFTVYALDEPFVAQKPSVGPRDLLGTISSHVLATGTLVGTFRR